ncbi:MAG: HTH domain-containing protein [Candidatus Micrarchaeota archaeon]
MKSSDVKAESSKTDFRKKRKRRAPKTAGRPVSLDAHARSRLLEVYYSHPFSLRELADMFGVSRMTVWRTVQDAPLPLEAAAFVR